jgi:hypothetical protein
MGAPAIQSSICDTDEILELQDLGGTLRFGSESELRNYIENTAARSPRRKVRAFGGSNREINEMAKPTLDSCEDNKISNEDLVAERLDDVLAVGATSVADLDNLIKQLQDARDYLQAESERVRLANERYAHLAQTASASAKIITDSMGQWRNSSPALSPQSDPRHPRPARTEAGPKLRQQRPAAFTRTPATTRASHSAPRSARAPGIGTTKAKVVARSAPPVRLELPFVIQRVSLSKRTWPIVGLATAGILNLGWICLLGYGCFQLARHAFFH